MSVTDYERKFVRLSRYARECVSSEAIMCKRFEDGLNEDIKMFVGVLEIREFVVLVERACKAEELRKEKQKVDVGTGEFRKRSILKSKSPTLSKPPFGTILVELRNGMYRTTRLLWVVDPLDLYKFWIAMRKWLIYV